MLHQIDNRHIKNDSVLQFVPPNRMQTGVTLGAVLRALTTSSTKKTTLLLPQLLGWDPKDAAPQEARRKRWNDAVKFANDKWSSSKAHHLEPEQSVRNALKELAAMEKLPQK